MLFADPEEEPVVEPVQDLCKLEVAAPIKQEQHASPPNSKPDKPMLAQQHVKTGAKSLGSVVAANGAAHKVTNGHSVSLPPQHEDTAAARQPEVKPEVMQIKSEPLAGWEDTMLVNGQLQPLANGALDPAESGMGLHQCNGCMCPT